ncbi:putative concanavalin A-like lectin/glucanase domain-containing protein [Rosa chinensis]|uniref:Putative concanavalin A-like lectin/glucanase domain-containing protein n=1 Tax=Rosa chinensis TaxID=74649 RepID=A0A2P6SIM6_ROSCH|nr:putative concanavalin A-like lectin/glucanase domain-containing protein [Rosa chinensis]
MDLHFSLLLSAIQFRLTQLVAFLDCSTVTCFNQQSEIQILVVEFDTYQNTWNIPVEPLVGININKISSAVTASWNFSSKESRKVANALIIYNATMKDLQVFWTYEEILVFHTDNPEWVTIGFAAATGRPVQSHAINSWYFISSQDPDEKRSQKIMKTQRWKAFLMAWLIVVPFY